LGTPPNGKFCLFYPKSLILQQKTHLVIGSFFATFLAE